jgi:hypothetical protein
MRTRTFLLIFLTIVSCSLLSRAQQQLWSGILAPVRGTNWAQAGVTGGIPSNSWTQCGATIAPYGSSSAPASPSTISTALSSCSGKSEYVLLGPGTFYLNNGICMTGVNNVELRGSGANSTFLVFSGAASCNNGNGSALIGFQSSDGTWFGAPATVYNWTGGYSQGATSITLSSGANITAGSTMIFLDQCDTGFTGSSCSGTPVDNGNFFDCGDGYGEDAAKTGCSVMGADNGNGRTHRFQSETVQAVSCSPACGSSGATTVTITPALIHPNWASGQAPQAWLVQPSSFVGVRNLSANGAKTQCTGGITFTNVENGWVQGTALLNSYDNGIYLEATAHMSIVDNYVYNTGQNLVYSDPMSVKDTLGSDSLFQNNIVQGTRIAFVNGEGPSVGDVIAYNLAINCNDAADGMWGCYWQHSNGDDYNLYEGNVGNQMFMDQIHGTHLMLTMYRNFFTGWESCANGNCGGAAAKDAQISAADVLSYNRYSNWIGNVLGTPGVMNEYSFTNAGYYTSSSDMPIWNVSSGNNGGTYIVPTDPLTGSTMLRWGNYDTFNKAIEWNASEVPSSLSIYANSAPTACVSGATCPPSLYLPLRPNWWSSSIPFPAIGPDVTSGNVGICSGTPNTKGQFADLPAISNSQCTGTSLTTGAWGGHVNAIPAMACYLNTMKGTPDGTGAALPFDATSCYYSATSSGPLAPLNVTGTVTQQP